jgi:DNA-binding transcriptional ArsR family regulator
MREVRLVLNAADLGRVRLLSSADPIEEMTLAAHRMSILAKDPLFGQWARHTVTSLGPAGAAVLDVLDSAFVQVSDLTRSWPNPGVSFGESLDGILSSPRSVWRSEIDQIMSHDIPPGPAAGLAEGSASALNKLGAALQRFHRSAVEPYWNSLDARARVAREALARTLVNDGLDALLNGLHPDVSWRDPVLTIRILKSCPPNCVHSRISAHMVPLQFAAGGRGLWLMPSIFAGTVTLRVPDRDETEPFLLTYPVIADLNLFVQDHSVSSKPLNDLIGVTRARLLQALCDRTLSTSELARASRVSISSASEHATVLRESQLLKSTRVGNRVEHSLTALGRTLVESTAR